MYIIKCFILLTTLISNVTSINLINGKRILKSNQLSAKYELPSGSDVTHSVTWNETNGTSIQYDIIKNSNTGEIESFKNLSCPYKMYYDNVEFVYKCRYLKECNVYIDSIFEDKATTYYYVYYYRYANITTREGTLDSPNKSISKEFTTSISHENGYTVEETYGISLTCDFLLHLDENQSTSFGQGVSTKVTYSDSSITYGNIKLIETNYDIDTFIIVKMEPYRDWGCINFPNKFGWYISGYKNTATFYRLFTNVEYKLVSA